MTVFLRALWGPFGRTAGTSLDQLTIYWIDWHFFGVREDESMGFWTLRFDVPKRKFSVSTHPSFPTAKKVKNAPRVRRGAPILGPVVHPDAFMPSKPMVYGRTHLDILRPRLTAEDVALMTRAALRLGQ